MAERKLLPKDFEATGSAIDIAFLARIHQGIPISLFPRVGRLFSCMVVYGIGTLIRAASWPGYLGHVSTLGFRSWR